MKIHLVAIDIDGTLLNSSKQISDNTVKAIATARLRLGTHVVLASARPPRTVMPFYRQLELDTPMINYNGALVYDVSSSRVLLHRPIGPKAARRIADLARAVYPEVLVSAEILDHWYTDKIDHSYLTETGKLYRPDVVAPLDEWLTQPVTKLLLLGEPDLLAAVAPVVRKEFLHQVSIVQTDEYLLQVMHATASKTQALRVVAAELGVNREQVMAIGDNANDVGMLSWAGVGVAMANAVPSALQAADFVTDHNDADGVAEAFRKFVLSDLPEI
jgi:Cof subfamily protein (haloacid dehalogenase superfamily)